MAIVEYMILQMIFFMQIRTSKEKKQGVLWLLFIPLSVIGIIFAERLMEHFLFINEWKHKIS